MLTTLLGAGGVAAATAGLIVFIFRTWISEKLKNSIQHEYDQKMELFRAQLNAKSDKEIEELKAKLQIAATERSVQFSLIYTKSAETLAETYARLIAFRQAVADYVSYIEYKGGPTKAESRTVVGNKLADFQEFYRPKRIYIPRNLAAQIDKFVQGLYDISIQFKIGVEQGNEYKLETIEDLSIWQKANDYVHGESPKLLTSMEVAFQDFLGVPNHELR